MTSTTIALYIGMWLLTGSGAAIYAILQKRRVGPSILTGLLLGPLALAFPVTPRLPLRRRTPGWYPWWNRTHRQRYWDGQAWTDHYVSENGKLEASKPAPAGWYPNTDGTEGRRWWDGQAWSGQPHA